MPDSCLDSMVAEVSENKTEKKDNLSLKASSFKSFNSSNQLSLHSDIVNHFEYGIPSGPKINDTRHRKHKSISFGEDFSDFTSYKNVNGYASSDYSRHRRVNSWSENYSNSLNYGSLQRNSSDAKSCYLMSGNQNQIYNRDSLPHGKKYIKTKSRIKTNKRFCKLVLAQTLVIDAPNVYTGHNIKIGDNHAEESNRPVGAIWTIKFSKNGKYMASAGQNCTIVIWKVLRDPERSDNIDLQDLSPHEPSIKVFHDAPARIYRGHTADILDLSWSKSNFLVSASMDKTVRLWHISQNTCLCVFRHQDIVTSVRFHPKDDRYFLSGCYDRKLRMWSIIEKKVAFWNELPVDVIVTAVGFTLDGRTACIGADSGDVFFFETQGLKYNTQILVKHQGNKKGKKVTGIEPMPGMPPGEERILVTTNNSRVWIINMKDKSFVHKYKGIDNPSMQIRASFSDDGRYIVCGSEDGCVYMWCTDQVSFSPFQLFQDSRIKAAAYLGHLGDQMLQAAMQDGPFSEERHTGLSGWLRKGERRVIDKLRSLDEHFEAHPHVVTTAIFAPTKTRQVLAKPGGDIIFDNTPVYVHRKKSLEEERHGAFGYEDILSDRRKSRSSSMHNNRNSKDSIRAYSDMDDISSFIMRNLVEATPEEKEYYQYPDSHIIVSSDLYGAIKVWRMDSGVYEKESNNTVNIDNEKPSVSPLTSEYHTSKSEKNYKRKSFTTFFSKFK